MISTSSSSESLVGKLTILKKNDPTTYTPWKKAITNLLIGKQLDSYISKNPSTIAQIIPRWEDCEENKVNPCQRGKLDFYHKIKGEQGDDVYLCNKCYKPLKKYELKDNELKVFNDERAKKAQTYGFIFATIDFHAKEAVGHIDNDSPLKLWDELNSWYQQNTKSYKLTLLTRALNDFPKDPSTDNTIEIYYKANGCCISVHSV
ncbi:MAG: hypothetical protein Sylvanvirus5_23 [Sylvanvirus sp.]|uniref:Uncharacterized protein n=1 Tax=Sylvanvirus sp. TaxID=2487774 RepID=A0A3G5AHH0_9VIRU|nr:MAG: hypothetical protein Sylvanvirus5_23 [Sylvanvirus sp.]